jgi:predicted PurR-regulated permease PerM
MFVIARSPRAALISGLIAIAISAFIYFVIVKPQTDNANKQVTNALSQADQQTRTASQQLNQALNNAKTQAPADNAQINAAQNKANKVLSCVQAAGTDVTKLAACHTP